MGVTFLSSVLSRRRRIAARFTQLSDASGTAGAAAGAARGGAGHGSGGVVMDVAAVGVNGGDTPVAAAAAAHSAALAAASDAVADDNKWIVDGNSLLFHLLGSFREAVAVNHGEADADERRGVDDFALLAHFRRWFDDVRAAGVAISTLVWDGTRLDQLKAAEEEQRFAARLRRLHSAFEWYGASSHRTMPTSAKGLLAAAATAAGIACVVADGEADRAVAEMARAEGALVVTGDSDFVCYDTPGVVLLDHAVVRNGAVSCFVFSHAGACAAVGELDDGAPLTSVELQMWASLMGNDYTRGEAGADTFRAALVRTAAARPTSWWMGRLASFVRGKAVSALLEELRDAMAMPAFAGLVSASIAEYQMSSSGGDAATTRVPGLYGPVPASLLPLTSGALPFLRDRRDAFDHPVMMSNATRLRHVQLSPAAQWLTRPVRAAEFAVLMRSAHEMALANVAAGHGDDADEGASAADASQFHELGGVEFEWELFDISPDSMVDTRLGPGRCVAVDVKCQGDFGCVVELPDVASVRSGGRDPPVEVSSSAAAAPGGVLRWLPSEDVRVATFAVDVGTMKAARHAGGGSAGAGGASPALARAPSEESVDGDVSTLMPRWTLLANSTERFARAPCDHPELAPPRVADGAPFVVERLPSKEELGRMCGTARRSMLMHVLLAGSPGGDDAVEAAVDRIARLPREWQLPAVALRMWALRRAAASPTDEGVPTPLPLPVVALCCALLVALQAGAATRGADAEVDAATEAEAEADGDGLGDAPAFEDVLPGWHVGGDGLAYVAVHADEQLHAGWTVLDEWDEATTAVSALQGMLAPLSGTPAASLRDGACGRRFPLGAPYPERQRNSKLFLRWWARVTDANGDLPDVAPIGAVLRDVERLLRASGPERIGVVGHFAAASPAADCGARAAVEALLAAATAGLGADEGGPLPAAPALDLEAKGLVKTPSLGDEDDRLLSAGAPARTPQQSAARDRARWLKTTEATCVYVTVPAWADAEEVTRAVNSIVSVADGDGDGGRVVTLELPTAVEQRFGSDGSEELPHIGCARVAMSSRAAVDAVLRAGQTQSNFTAYGEKPRPQLTYHGRAAAGGSFEGWTSKTPLPADGRRPDEWVDSTPPCGRAYIGGIADDVPLQMLQHALCDPLRPSSRVLPQIDLLTGAISAVTVYGDAEWVRLLVRRSGLQSPLVSGRFYATFAEPRNVGERLCAVCGSGAMYNGGAGECGECGFELCYMCQGFHGVAAHGRCAHVTEEDPGVVCTLCVAAGADAAPSRVCAMGARMCAACLDAHRRHHRERCGSCAANKSPALVRGADGEPQLAPCTFACHCGTAACSSCIGEHLASHSCVPSDASAASRCGGCGALWGAESPHAFDCFSCSLDSASFMPRARTAAPNPRSCARCTDAHAAERHKCPTCKAVWSRFAKKPGKCKDSATCQMVLCGKCGGKNHVYAHHKDLWHQRGKKLADARERKRALARRAGTRRGHGDRDGWPGSDV
mmetsp:Transcript_16268/g.56821  ORF Transcript_16268/g.56821 Transcript_16268/m.56821 type:complete len:1496 (-) Transcript_16268:171-4658(-)